MTSTTSAREHYLEAIRLRDRILLKKSNEAPVQAWDSVCRACAKAFDAHGREMKQAGRTFAHRSDLSFLDNLDRVWDRAKAQVETIARNNQAANKSPVLS